MKLFDDDFEKIYTIDKFNLETFSPDIDYVLKINDSHPLRVWTAIDCDDGMYLVNGMRYVNRVYYVTTLQDAVNEEEEYLIDSYEDTANF